MQNQYHNSNKYVILPLNAVLYLLKILPTNHNITGDKFVKKVTVNCNIHYYLGANHL